MRRSQTVSVWIPGSDPPVVLLVVDDFADDELVSIFAQEDMVPAPDFGGSWSSSLMSAVVRFTLERVSGGVSPRSAVARPDG